MIFLGTLGDDTTEIQETLARLSAAEDQIRKLHNSIIDGVAKSGFAPVATLTSYNMIRDAHVNVAKPIVDEYNKKAAAPQPLNIPPRLVVKDAAAIVSNSGERVVSGSAIAQVIPELGSAVVPTAQTALYKVKLFHATPGELGVADWIILLGIVLVVGSAIYIAYMFTQSARNDAKTIEAQARVAEMCNDASAEQYKACVKAGTDEKQCSNESLRRLSSCIILGKPQFAPTRWGLLEWVGLGAGVLLIGAATYYGIGYMKKHKESALQPAVVADWSW